MFLIPISISKTYLSDTRQYIEDSVFKKKTTYICLMSESDLFELSNFTCLCSLIRAYGKKAIYLSELIVRSFHVIIYIFFDSVAKIYVKFKAVEMDIILRPSLHHYFVIAIVTLLGRKYRSLSIFPKTLFYVRGFVL